VEVVAPEKHAHAVWRWKAIVGQLFGDPKSRQSLLDIHEFLGGERWAARTHMTDEQLRRVIARRVEEALLHGELQLLYRPRLSIAGSDSGGGANGNGNGLARSAAQPPLAGKRPEPEKTWVEFKLVDKLQRPVAGARYQLKITDGSVREGALDENGSVRVRGIDPGDCEITFPDFDGREWKRA
jgi:hypothetical protein